MNKPCDITEQVVFEWQREIANGNERAFRLLFNHFIKRLTNFAYSIIQNNEAATEIVDSVFVSIWKCRIDFVEVKYIKTYLYTSVKNGCLNYISKKARELVTDPFDNIHIKLTDACTPELELMSAELYKKINDAVDTLPPKCKMVFKLVREDGLRYKDVAQILNLSVKTVDAQMVIAIKKISDRVRADFDFYPQPAKKSIF